MSPSDARPQEPLGLTSIEALKRLSSSIEHELAHCSCRAHGRQGLRFWIGEAFSHNSFSSTFRWPSILLTGICLIILLAGYHWTNDRSFLLESLFLFLVLAANVFIVGWDTRAYHTEVHTKAARLGCKIRESIIENKNDADIRAWSSGKFYPQLHLPQSPCITLQWTLRDGHKINLPTPLLVEGDIVYLCPGAAVPGRCKNVEPLSANSENVSLELQAGDLFVPTVDSCATDFTSARLRKAVVPIKFVMMETPFLDGLRLCLQKSWMRPRSLYDRERHTIVAKYIEQIIVPLIWFSVLLTSFIHYFYLKAADVEITTWSNTAHFVVLRPALSILPLIPLALPFSWLLLNAYGVAHLLHIGSMSESINPLNADNIRLKQTSKDLYFDDIDTDIGSETNVAISPVGWRRLCRSVFGLMLNRNGNLWRSANLLQVLGSITALCCIDKKGILSWPNPAADKVFVLTTPRTKKHSSTSDPNSLIVSDTDNLSDISGQNDSKAATHRRRERKSKYLSKPEVLDVTPDPHNALGLQFDDPDWFRFLPNLKPLGLAILLNTCNKEVKEEYTQFCDHISCESLHNEAAVPVVNKRCLCELARQIGFTESAVKDYQYLFQVAMFRHVKPEVIQQGKLAKSLNIPRLKMPFPHMASAVIKEQYTNTYQLFSQGTGDLVLDACTEFWDGTDLRVLTDIDRKRILDFYHRTCLTAYCMAFSYVPLTHCPESRLLGNEFYLELPPDSSHLFSTTKCLDPNVRALRWSENNNDNLPSSQSRINHHLSNESLRVKEKEKEKRSTSSSPSSSDTTDLETMTNQVNNEVFIGMVTMQYQACPDFVQLVEQLEKACIRFVHFSKENELRSRVFSEKMGLESGWNCHISLLSDNTSKGDMGSQAAFASSLPRGSKTSLNEIPSTGPTALLRCQSAPSSINLETTVVKFMEGETVVDISKDGSSESSNDNVSVASSDSSSSERKEMSNSYSEKINKKKVLANISPSPSRMTESTGTDTNSAPIPFDMHNRAKLPKGIENIRPHLVEVDNVPLLVSLFTDCTPATTTEMISIMQEYGEVVCVLGSSSNLRNFPTFVQADASIGIEPLYPQLCVTEEVIIVDEELASQVSEDFISPTELAKQLVSLPCCLSLHREDPFSMSRLIMEARHYMINVRTSLQFFLCCCLSLSLAQLLTSLLFLPPLLSPGLVLWLVCVVLPVLSFSLLGTSCDPTVMTIATGKNLNLSRDSIFYFLICYLIKFSPSILIVITCFALMVKYSCHAGGDLNLTDSPGPCWMYIDIKKGNSEQFWSTHLLLSQTFVSLLLVIYFIAISIGFVHHCHLLWQRSPFHNRWWVYLSIGLLLSHLAFCWGEIALYEPSPEDLDKFFEHTPVAILICGFLWPVLLIAVNSLIKRHEIKIYNRQQRRARLEFNTKLGMNSPF